MTREQQLQSLQSQEFDVLIIGGGASGLGCAVDAASRGLKTALIEAGDFCSGTSSKSSKLIHGGVRYLELAVKQRHWQQLMLVRDALHERAVLLRIAPSIVHPLRLLTPCRSHMEAAYYWLGLQAYDALSGHLSMQATHYHSHSSLGAYADSMRMDNVAALVGYSDAQFDDCALGMALVQTARHHGACMLNYCTAAGFRMDPIRYSRIGVIDQVDGHRCQITTRCVINCTGPRSDNLRRQVDPKSIDRIQCSAGAHIVVDRDWWPHDEALLIPKTSDGRVLFIIPWHNKVLIGTTDEQISFADRHACTHKQRDYLIEHAAGYLARPLQASDIRSAWSGIRPLLQPSRQRKSAKIIRDHRVFIEGNGIISLCGGKWTTYRLMAQDCIDQICNIYRFQHRPCWTRKLGLLQYPVHAQHDWYGLCRWAVEHTHACHIDDILARRSRTAFLDIAAAIEDIPMIGLIMQSLLGWSEDRRLSEERKAQSRLEQQFFIDARQAPHSESDGQALQRIIVDQQ